MSAMVLTVREEKSPLDNSRPSKFTVVNTTSNKARSCFQPVEQLLKKINDSKELRLKA